MHQRQHADKKLVGRTRTNRRAPTHSRARPDWEHIARQDSSPPLFCPPPLPCHRNHVLSQSANSTFAHRGGGRGGGNRTPAVITALTHLSKHTEPPPRLDSLCFTPYPSPPHHHGHYSIRVCPHTGR